MIIRPATTKDAKRMSYSVCKNTIMVEANGYKPYGKIEL